MAMPTHEAFALAAPASAAPPLSAYVTLTAWLKQNGYQVYGGGTTGKAATHPRGAWSHLLLNGGKLAVPMGAAYDTFLRLYARDVATHAHYYYHEELTDVFLMMIDLDLELCADEDADALVLRIMTAVQAAIAEWYPDAAADALRVIVCTAPVVPIGGGKTTPDGGAVRKCGVHGYWWATYVNTALALDQRESMLARLRRDLGERPAGVKPWDDVVDHLIYGRGLRMVGSYKAKKCEACRGVRPAVDSCVACERGFVYDMRAYRVAYVMRRDGTVDVPETDRLSDMGAATSIWAQRTALRTTLAAPSPFVRPATAPPCPLASSVERKRRRAAASSSTAPALRSAMAAPFEGGEVVPLDTPLADMMGVFVRRCLAPTDVYANVRVTRVTRVALSGAGALKHTNRRAASVMAARHCYLVNVDGEGSSYCHNLGRAHRGKSIYFYVGANGAHQRCFCRCADTADRVTGKPCKEFRSASAPVPADLLRLMYPTSADEPIAPPTAPDDDDDDDDSASPSPPARRRMTSTRADVAERDMLALLDDLIRRR